jgi:hypothetical protein
MRYAIAKTPDVVTETCESSRGDGDVVTLHGNVIELVEWIEPHSLSSEEMIG